ncbi:hypothetical protein AOQ73_18145 [Bradyrhizobium pachyrhizi]|uniref:hypothetical protein n=1 Tax=Bradyrhizobium pachyrhizi TaxID=280333 RepID=UPI0007055DEF|nr:hypothetical protein [Bradyrhizobium pachyrhizi]KRQ01276.1 hypothetical protein AOQ73_18145 [Bradyrhizobium pachyrhizi]
MAGASVPSAGFDAINWLAIDPGLVCAFYEATGRPLGQRVLLQPFADVANRETWRRQCLADLVAMQDRACPTCGI